MSIIHYALQENHLTSDPNDYAARVQFTATVGPEEVARHMVELGDPLPEAEILGVLNRLAPACGSLVAQGNRVNLGGVCLLSPSIHGVFHGPTDHFDQARHRVDAGASAGQPLRKLVRENAQVAKVEASKPTPILVQYVDLGSGETDGKLTPGNIGTIDGYRLKFDPAKSDEGIFLVPAEGAGGKEIPVTQVQNNKPSQLIFLNPPNVRKGDYHLEVRARMRDSGEIRTGRLEAILTV